ncbi:hypothetical protein CMO88_01165 [Candidatus Woesearchaeota archaeon]|nr:hypothetical protein [Candidatus Woesearchaeota archaeon]|tara:strand:+ start:320 stop:1780 length:1461 start_codon:yes stop_codon:yes gene_type:complete
MRFFLIIFLSAFLLTVLSTSVSAFCGDNKCIDSEQSWCNLDCSDPDPVAECGNDECEVGEESWCTLDCHVIDTPEQKSCTTNTNTYAPSDEPYEFNADKYETEFSGSVKTVCPALNSKAFLICNDEGEFVLDDCTTPFYRCTTLGFTEVAQVCNVPGTASNDAGSVVSEYSDLNIIPLYCSDEGKFDDIILTCGEGENIHRTFCEMEKSSVHEPIVTSEPECKDTRITIIDAPPAPAPSPAPDPSPTPTPDPTPVPNSNPTITDFNVPLTADKGSQITISVTATDSDGTIDRIEILQDSDIIKSESCGNIATCAKSFVVQVPNAFSTAYKFIARAFDNLGASATRESEEGTTNPEVIPDTPETPEPEPDEALDDVKVKHSGDLFVSTVAPGESCVSPGAETFLYASLKNNGDKTVKNVKIIAVVYDLSLRAVSNNFNIRRDESVSRFLNFDVPEDAEEGLYYMKISVNSQKDSIVKYRVFEVNNVC